MTPIERISARSKALATLGMAGNPTRSQLRKAFRRLAFERHPDHGKGSAEEFARISEAYNFLFATAEDDSRPVSRPANRVSRPTVRVSETEFDESALAACRAVLDTAGAAGASHVATRLHRKGRMLTYFVPTAAAEGLNLVALPTGDLVDTRVVRPRQVDVWSGDLCGGSYDVPAQICARDFPGARSVRISFGDVKPH